MTFNPIDILLLISYGAIIYMPHLKNAKHLMVVNMITTGLTGVYLYYTGTPTSVALCAIAVVSTFIQLILPTNETNQLKK